MTTKFTCYVPEEIGIKLKDLQEKECLNVSKFIVKAILEKLNRKGNENEY